MGLDWSKPNKPLCLSSPPPPPPAGEECSELGVKSLWEIEMEKSFTLIHTIATAGAFSAISFWFDSLPEFGRNFVYGFLYSFSSCSIFLRYGFMFGRESARKDLGGLIEDLRRGSSNSDSSSESPRSWLGTVCSFLRCVSVMILDEQVILIDSIVLSSSFRTNKQHI